MGGFAKVFDVVGSTTTLNTSIRVLTTGGVLSVVGIGTDAMTDLTPLWLKLQTIKGVFTYGYIEVRKKRKHIFDIAIDLVKKKRVHLESMVTHTLSIEDYKEMIEINLNKGKHKALKTVVSFG